MIRSENAVSEVIGMVLILSIMVIVIGTIMLVGMPMIEASRDRTKMDVTENTFLSLQNDIEEVVRGPIWVRDPNITNGTGIGPSRETVFELMGGMLSEAPSITRITYTQYGDNFTIIIPPSNITYTAGNEDLVYENGAVIRKYESGKPLMISDPLINIYNTKDNTITPQESNVTIAIHAISLNGTPSSTGGDGKAQVEAGLVSYNHIIEPQSPPFPNSNMANITIYSNYRPAWREFFNKTLSEAGLEAKPQGSNRGYYISETDPLKIEIYGNANNVSQPDIFLSVYESRININIW